MGVPRLTEVLSVLPPAVAGELINRLGLADNLSNSSFLAEGSQLIFSSVLRLPTALEFQIPGIDGLFLRASGKGGAQAIILAVLYREGHAIFSVEEAEIALGIPTALLKPVDPAMEGVVLSLGGAFSLSDDGAVSIDIQNSIDLPRSYVGGSPIIISASGLTLDFSRDSSPGGLDPEFMGLYLQQGKLELHEGWPVVPDDLILQNWSIGSGGVSGQLRLIYQSYDPITKTFGGKGTVKMFGVTFGLQEIDIEFKQNTLITAKIAGTLLLPFFDEPVDVEISFDLDGKLDIVLKGTDADGLKEITKPGILSIKLETIELEVGKGVFTAKLSGQITPLLGGLNWPSYDVRELYIDSKGDVHLEGGWMHLTKSYALDFDGAKLEITKFGMGKTDDGGRYIGMSGCVKLVKGLAAGASVEGLRLVWYDDGRLPALSFNGIGVSFATPALAFYGQVSYTQNGNAHEFRGDLLVIIVAANDLTLMGKAVFGTDKNGTRYFAIYVEGEFDTGIPLWATGLSLYGFEGLLAVNYAPDKPADMLWYSVDPAKSWFHKPEKGVIDIVKKWKPEPGTFALGAGVAVGTESDNGHGFNGKFLLLLLCPGPVLMIDGSARFLVKRDDPSEPPFHGLIVLDDRAGYFLVGLDAHWKCDKAQGAVADISGSIEAFFNYHDPTQWHLWLGKRDPMSQRIQARIGKVFNGNVYFMLNAKQLALGAWIGKSGHYKWGPVGADLEAYFDANAIVNFKPAQLHVDLHLHGH